MPDTDNNPLAAAYLRVSTSEQGRPDRPSLGQQEERITALCQAHGWTVIETYQDVVSGRRWERPGLQQLLADAETGTFARLVVLAIDRLGRNLKDLLEITERLRANGVALVSVKESIDTESASGNLYYQLLGAFSEFESHRIAERTSDGRHGSVRAGKYLAPTTPYGYRREGGQLVEDPIQAAVVRQIFQWTTEGMGLRAVATRLNEEGVLPPNPEHTRRKSKWGWQFRTVQKIITAGRYAGHAVYGGLVTDPGLRRSGDPAQPLKHPRYRKDADLGTPMHCPSLVTDELFEAANAALGQRRFDQHRDAGHFYLLQDLVFCQCGSKYLVKTNREGGQSYACRRRRTYGPAAGHEGVRWSWPASVLERAAKQHVARLLVDPTYLEREAARYEVQAKRAQTDREAELRHLRNHLEELDAEQRRLIRALRKGTVSEDQVEEELNAIGFERRAVEGRLRTLQQSPISVSGFMQQAGELRNVAALFQHVRELVPGADWNDDAWTDGVIGSDEAWQQTIRQLVTRIVVNDNGSLTFEGVQLNIPSRGEAHLNASRYMVTVRTPRRARR